MKYENIWNAVDKLAKMNGLSPSGLAKKSGLDATTFNKSKRRRPDGKKRWPSLDSINRITEACNISFEQFYKLCNEKNETDLQSAIPYALFSKLKSLVKKPGVFDTSSWVKMRFPDGADNLYAVELDTNWYEPIYLKKHILVVTKNSDINKGDKVIAVLKNGETHIGEFLKRGGSYVEISDIIDRSDKKTLVVREIKLFHRILWAEQ